MASAHFLTVARAHPWPARAVSTCFGKKGNNFGNKKRRLLFFLPPSPPSTRSHTVHTLALPLSLFRALSSFQVACTSAGAAVEEARGESAQRLRTSAPSAAATAPAAAEFELFVVLAAAPPWAPRRIECGGERGKGRSFERPEGEDEQEEMGNCGTREESAVAVAVAAQPTHVQQLHLLQQQQAMRSAAAPERKHARNFSTTSDTPTTPMHIDEGSDIAIYTDVISFTLYELETITKSFRSDYVLGEGGFGTVYKGYINENVRVGLKSVPVAVKVLNRDGHQGHREWLTEVNFLGQLRHPNLVKLIGYCCEDDHRLLVYEFMFRGSLENHLFRRTAAPLPWQTRMSIALGAAKGLAFLHNAERPVIYRDFKTSNILLDSDYTAKLSDFGLAKAGPEGDETHVSTRVMGTCGYAAPEYVMTGHLTARSDVYSFGVVLLELLTGRKSLDKSRPSREHSLVDWARPKLNDKRRLFQIIDPRLEGSYSVRAAQKACTLAYYCLSHNPKARPLMTDVVETLEPLQGAAAGDALNTLHTNSFPEYRAHRRLPAGGNVNCRAIPSPKCSPAVPACPVR